MIASMGSYTFVFFAVCDVVMGVVVIFFVKETRGKSLEEMETLFHIKAAFDVALARDKARPSADISHNEQAGPSEA